MDSSASRSACSSSTSLRRNACCFGICLVKDGKCEFKEMLGFEDQKIFLTGFSFICRILVGLFILKCGVLKCPLWCPTFSTLTFLSLMLSKQRKLPTYASESEAYLRLYVSCPNQVKNISTKILEYFLPSKLLKTWKTVESDGKAPNTFS